MNSNKTLIFTFLAFLFLGIVTCQQTLSQVSSLVINELLSSNSRVISDEDGDYEDWIELKNAGYQSINLGGYGLSDNPEDAFKWVFPDTLIEPGEYVIIWASGKDRTKPGTPLHTNFSISAAGEYIILSHPDGTAIDELQPVRLRSDISYGRFPDGSGTWFFFDEPTPGSANITKAFSEVLESPIFSSKSGFYPQSFNLNLSHADKEVNIYYTLDGSVPDPDNLDGKTYSYKNRYPRNPGQSTGDFLSGSYKSILYTNPIPVYDLSAEPDKLTNISSTFDYTPNYFPLYPVKKGRTVSATAVKEGAISSEPVIPEV